MREVSLELGAQWIPLGLDTPLCILSQSQIFSNLPDNIFPWLLSGRNQTQNNSLRIYHSDCVESRQVQDFFYTNQDAYYLLILSWYPKESCGLDC